MSSKSLSSRKITRTARLYLLLSWLIAGYYVIWISRESGSLGDVEDTRSSRQSVLLLKQLNKLKSCPVVRLRGLSRSKGKARPINRFEAFIFLNVICFVLRLRSLVSLVKDLLLRAGDVEVNPGPTPPGTPDYSGELSSTASANVEISNPGLPNTDSSESSTPGVEGESGTTYLNGTLPGGPDNSASSCDVDQIEPLVENTSNIIHVFGRSVSIPETALSARNEPVDREVAEQTTSPLAMVQTSEHFLDSIENKDGVQSDNISYKQPLPHDQKATESSEIAKRSIQSTTKDHNKKSCIPITLKNGDVCMIRKSKSSSSIPSLLVRDPSKEEVQQLKTKVLNLHSELPDDIVEELKWTDKALHKLMDFFITANKLYRCEERCPVCPICLNIKKERAQQKSHIIPRCILDYYWKIHGTDASYMHDFSRCQMLTAKALTYQLLCKDCEARYSESENHLFRVYADIAANPDIDYIMVHESEQSASWLIHILTNILFRGILTNIDLSNIKNESIIKSIYHLWKYCRKFNGACHTLKLKVFLLPNKPFNEILHDFMFPFELLVRMPHCTELIERDDVGTFFYTKFDVFHVVLPLCEKSNAYFDTFNNGLTVERKNLCLRWTTLQKAEIYVDRKTIEFKYPTKSAILKDYFPEALLQWCASLYEEYISRLYNHPIVVEAKLKPFLSALDRFRTAHYMRFNTEYRMKMAEPLQSVKIFDQRSSWTTFFDDQKRTKEQREEVLSKAIKHSPLRRKNIEKLNAELACAKKENDDNTKKLGDVMKELGDTRLEYGNIKQKQEELESKVAHLEDELHVARDIHEIETLLMEAQIRADEEELESLTCLVKSSLRHNQGPEHPKTDVGILKDIIAAKVKEFKDLIKVAERLGPQMFTQCQSYRKLHEKCQNLLSLTLPSSPTPSTPK